MRSTTSSVVSSIRSLLIPGSRRRYLHESYSRSMCSFPLKTCPLKVRAISKAASPRVKPLSLMGIPAELSGIICPLRYTTLSPCAIVAFSFSPTSWMPLIISALRRINYCVV